MRTLAIALLCSVLLPTGLAAQTTGVRLGLQYKAEQRPVLVVLPIGYGASQTAAKVVESILQRDLEFSNRFTIRASAGVPADTGSGDLAAWVERGADWVLSGNLQPREGGLALRLVLHDAVYGRTKGSGSFHLPRPDHPDFRMAVHAASDQVVAWATGESGYAASRIAFVRHSNGNKEVYVVDSDGENLRQITRDGSTALSPAWHPDGHRIAYMSFRNDLPFLYERDLRTGIDRVLSDRIGMNMTPAYSPDGATLAFATTVGNNVEIATLDRKNNCCLRQQTKGRRNDSLSPTFSPDGSRIAFVSNRMGPPHIFVMGLGGDPRLISEYIHGQPSYNTSPDWSPRGAQIAYHSRIKGVHQIVLADIDKGTHRLLTDRNNNEDPSWAPDGRHIVFASRDRDGGGLFIVDTVTGHTRTLVRGAGHGLPDWSGSVRIP